MPWMKGIRRKGREVCALREYCGEEGGSALNPSGTNAYGYEAMLLPRVCEVYLKARDAGKTARQR
jgi:hypothetical protein